MTGSSFLPACSGLKSGSKERRNRYVALVSWETILEKKPAVLYPAHGKPFKAKDLQKYLKTLDSVKLYALRE